MSLQMPQSNSRCQSFSRFGLTPQEPNICWLLTVHPLRNVMFVNLLFSPPCPRIQLIIEFCFRRSFRTAATVCFHVLQLLRCFRASVLRS